jgi:outer membrane protein TolC
MADVMAAPRSFGSTNVATAYRVEVTVPFPIFGQRGLRRDAAEAEARGMAWDLRGAQLDLVRDARTALVAYWRVSRAIAFNREIATLLPELRRVSLARYTAGLTGQQEPLQIDAEIAMLDHEAVVLQRERRVTVAILNVLMHETPERDLPPPPTELPPPDTTVAHADLAHEAHAQRPELRAADERVAASRARVSLAGREWLPQTGFGVAYDRFWSEPELRATVGVTMNLPLAIGRHNAAQDAARAGLAASEAQQAAVQDSIALEVATAAARLHEQAHDVDIATNRLVPLAERALHAARASYESNRADFTTVWNALRAFVQARLEADESLAMLQVARIDLDRALGEVPAALDPEVTP